MIATANEGSEWKEPTMYLYKVPEMSCQHCVATITKAVKAVDPSADVSADIGKGEVSVESAAESTRIEEAMKEAGYDSRRLST